MKSILVGLSVLLAVVCGGCSTGDSPSPKPTPVTITSIEVVPDVLNLQTGQTFQLEAVVKDQHGQVVNGKTLFWESIDTSKATVSASGLVSAIAEGNTQVYARLAALSAKTDIVVLEPTQGSIHRVELNTTTLSLEEGAQSQLVATAFDDLNQVISGLGQFWSSDSADVVHVTPSGMLTALRPGYAEIKVKIHGREATCQVTAFADHNYALIYSKSLPEEIEELYLLDIQPAVHDEQRVFPAGRRATQASVSPDGSRIAFVVHGQWDGQTWWQSMIFVADRDGGNHQQVVFLPARNENPAWSPDGTRIAFSSWESGKPAAIFVVNADGENLKNLTEDMPEASHRSPSWSPALIDGKYRIVFSSLQNGDSHLWTMFADGTDKQQITANPDYYDDSPDWSPDGSNIVFIRTGAAIFSDLYLVNSTGGGERALNPFYALPLNQTSPRWSPDGKFIAFLSSGDFDQVWTVWADGTKAVQRSEGSYFHTSPNWIPLL